MRDALLGTLLARVCCGFLGAVVLAAALGPWLSPWEFDAVDWDAIDTAPSLAHWFGTDGVGRDLLTRTLAGARVSIAIALAATVVSCSIGIPWGATAGYLGGRTDQAMMRIVDGLYALPFILLAGKDRVKDIMNWGLGLPSLAIRAWCLLGVGFGVFIYLGVH